MGTMKLHKKMDLADTPLSNLFIDDYMPAAPPVYALVYIMGMRRCAGGETDVGVKELALSLRLLESDVVKAWHYWADVGLVTILDDDPDNFSIEFQPVRAAKEDPAATAPNEPAARVKMAVQPSYTPREIEIFMERSDEVRVFFKTAEDLFGEPLTFTDLNMLFGFYEWYELPFDVIVVMLDYCISNGNRKKNYLQAVAKDWADNGIFTVEAARDHISLISGSYQIMKAFGITGKHPNGKQKEFIHKWINAYKLPLELIVEACEAAFLETGKPKFAYADTTLTAWFEQGVRTLAEAQKESETFRETKKKEAAEKTPARNQKPYQNRFINYEQREWDYEKIEALAQSRL